MFINQIIDLIQTSVFYEFAALLSLVAVVGLLVTFLKQPLIIAFIAIGVLAGPSVIGLVQSGDEVSLLAKLGITLLLFIVGLKLDVKLIRDLGIISVILGLGQIILTVVAGFGLSYWLGFSWQESFLIAVALSFSSTIIIVKLLTDNKEIDSMHGRLSLGLLIVQDVVVVLVMIVLATISAGSADSLAGSLFFSVLKVGGYSLILIVMIALFMRFMALRVLFVAAANKEMLLVYSISWAVLLAALCDILGLSKELGGLLAGISLASTPYREAIIARLSSLRDFLLLFFFIFLGFQIDISIIGNLIFPAILLSVFVLIFKPVVVIILAAFTGYPLRTGFLAGIALSQVSEFSLILASFAYGIGLIEKSIFGLITLSGLITITVSSYFIGMSHRLYDFCAPFLKLFDGYYKTHEESSNTSQLKKDYDIIIFGLGRYGKALVDGFVRSGKRVLAVDFNPQEVRKWKGLGFDAIYGDATDAGFFDLLPLKKAQWVISALPQYNTLLTDQDPRIVILECLAAQNYKKKIAVACQPDEASEVFTRLGTTLVFIPFLDAAQTAVDMALKE